MPRLISRHLPFDAFSARLIGSLAAMMLLIWAVMGYDYWRLQRLQLDNARIQAQGVAQAMDERVVRTIRTVDVVLRTLAQRIRERTPSAEASAIGEILHGIDPHFDELVTISFNNAQGIGVVNSNPAVPTGRSYASLDFFRIHVDHPEYGVFISAPIVGPASGKRLFLISRRVAAADGPFLGVLVASVSTDALAKKFLAERLGERGMIGLFHIPTKKTLVRQPEYERTFGETVANGTVFADLKNAPSGIFEGPSSFDGEKRIFVYRQLENTPLLLAIGIAVRDIDDKLKSDLFNFWIVVVLLTLAVAAAAAGILFAHRRQIKIQEALDSSEIRFRTLSEVSTVGIFHTDNERNCLYVNKQWSQITGMGLEQALGRGWMQGLHPDDATRVGGELDRATETRAPFKSEYRFLRPDGEIRWVLGQAREEVDTQGNVSGYAGTLTDITERKLAEEKMQLATLVYDTSIEAMMVTDADGTIITVNPAFTQMTGYAPDEIIGKTPRVLRSDRHDQAFYQAMWQDIIATGRWQGEIWDRRKNGEVYPKRLTINTSSSQDGTTIRRVSLFSDITEQKKSEEVIWRQANFDALTGLPNRRMFMDRLEQEIKKTRRADMPLALMFLDLDRFKEINDALGHERGDVVLKETAKRLAACVRESDTVARLGGDEFTIIMGDLGEVSSVERIAQDILQSLEKPFHLGSEIVYVTTSIGITFYPEDAKEMEALIKNADQAMYAAKSQGGDRYSYFTQTMQETAQKRMLLVKDLRSALAANQFRVYYQPIVELSTGEIRKAEALIRWQHPTRGLVGPAEFIPIAEETGMIIEIGDWVFYQAVRQASQWRASYRADFQISVNKSPTQFPREGVTHIPWVAHLKSHGAPGESVVVEITEGLLMEAGVAVTDHLLGFRDAGIQVALDDFGTGYSSLSYLNKFDIDYIKIDQSFVRNLAPESHDLALCEAIIVMAHKLGIKVVAEGVETENQRDLLVAINCDYAQGFLYSRPVPPEEFEKLLA